MKRIIAATLLGLALGAFPAGAKTITDMAGRIVAVPDAIGKVFSANPTAMLFLYTLVPEKLAGYNYKMTGEALKYVPASLRQLPMLGTLMGRSATANEEEIAAQRIDLLVFPGIDKATVADADRVSKRLAIPVVCIDYELASSAKAYRFLGELMGARERAEQLAVYCEEALRRVSEATARTGDAARKKVYYALGPDGLETYPDGSPNAELIPLAGATNAATFPGQSRFGAATVSFEQVAGWNPDLVLVGYYAGHEAGVSSAVYSGKDWATLPAVAQGRVLAIPQLPFNWFEKPASINRIIGLSWLAKVLNPQTVSYDLNSEIKRFYSLFYRVDLTDQDLAAILNPGTAERGAAR